MLKLFYLSVFVLMVNLTIAQKQTYNWIFGDSVGVNFSSGSPVPFYNSAMNQREGSACISDASGNLLFYTDGVSVWNKNHVIMPNGDWLNGNISSTQSALILQHPDSMNIYYLFTTDADGSIYGLSYSIIDMRLDGGKGDVTAVKNNLLYTPATEKLTAVKHRNGLNIWIISHQFYGDTFSCYLLTAAGLNLTPVISRSGVVNSGDAGCTPGYLKTSPNGRYLAMANSEGVDRRVELFTFDDTNGHIEKILTDSIFPIYVSPYGIEFSPQSRYVYASFSESSFSSIYQYDLLAGSPNDILASKNSIATVPMNALSDTGFICALQLATDGKIYVCPYFSPSLHAINFPDSAGNACGFQLNAVNFSCGHCYSIIGLPNFLTSYFNADATYTEIKATTDYDAAKPFISIAPNPSKGVINITSTVQVNTISVYNTLGQIVYTNNQLNTLTTDIDLSGIPNGTYYIQALTKDGLFKCKVVVGR